MRIVRTVRIGVELNKMFISKKTWLRSWTNCHTVHISKLRRNETGCNDKYSGIEPRLSITRVPIYQTKIFEGIDMDDFCKNCMRCVKRRNVGV